MYSIIATNNRVAQGVNFYLIDTLGELSQLIAKPGTKAYVLEDSKTYIINHKKQWTVFKPSLIKYVDEALAAYPGVSEEALNLAINAALEQLILSGRIITQENLDSAIDSALKDSAFLKEYLKKSELEAEAKRLGFIQSNEKDKENIIYVTGVTINDI